MTVRKTYTHNNPPPPPPPPLDCCIFCKLLFMAIAVLSEIGQYNKEYVVDQIDDLSIFIISMTL